MGFVPPQKLKPGERPTATDINNLRAQVYALGRPTSSGNIGVEQSGFGLQLTDISQTRLLARITSRGAGANYGWNLVVANDDGTFSDQPTGTTDVPWGTPTAAPAWELGGREDVPAGSSTDTPPGAIVELIPGQQDKANFYFRYGDGLRKSHHVKLVGTGYGECGGTAWASRIQELNASGAVVDGDYLGGSDASTPIYNLYPTKAEDGTVRTPVAGDIGIAIPDPNEVECWLFRPKRPLGFECGGCGWLEDLPEDTCFKFRMDGGDGRCSCIPSEGYSTSGSGNWVAALGGWVATQMKDSCCGCGGVLLEIDANDCTQTTVTLHQFHIKCDAGSGSGLFDLVMKYDCSGINELTGNRYARFVGKGASACDGDQEPCGNSFYLTVECFTCPEPVCGCCCEDWSPWSWYQWDVLGFGDDNLNGSWVWEYDDSTPNSCKWIATCGDYTSTIEYISSGGGKVRLTHHTYVYEIARSSWTCNGANVMAYVSGGGTRPANITLNPLQTVEPGVTPCDLPDSLEVELISAGCPDMNAVVTATRAIPGTGPWEYGTPGSLVVSVECGSDGRFEVAVSIECDDGSPPPIAFVAGTAPDAPDSAEWGPLELTWNNVPITGTPTVNGCCAEGSTVTIIVRE